MKSKSALGIRCNCGDKVKTGINVVEFFGIYFGPKPVTICSKCGSEYLSQNVIEEIEAEVRKRGL